MVKDDKVAVAQGLADSTMKIATKNVALVATQNTNIIE